MEAIAPTCALPGRHFLRPVLLIALACAAPLLAACGDSEGTGKAAPDPRAQYIPTVGAYEYATSGFESVDALLGQRNSYPDTTRIRIVERGCGYSERWSAGSHRRLQFTYCVFDDGARTLRSVSDFHEFFGLRVVLGYHCRSTKLPNLERVAIGFKWTDRCEGSSTNLTLRGTVIGRSMVRVGGQELETVGLRIIATSKGRSDGRSRLDSRRVARTGLLTRRTVFGTATTRTPVGRVHSRERYRLRLRDAEPVKPSSSS